MEHVGEGSGLMPMVYCLVRVLLTLSPQVGHCPFSGFQRSAHGSEPQEG